MGSVDDRGLKKYWSEFKWMARLSKPFFPQLLFLVLNGSAVSLCGVGFAIASRRLIDAATGVIKADIWSTAAVMALIIILQIGLQSACSVLSARTQERISNSIRNELFAQLMKKDWIACCGFHSGDLLVRMTSDAGSVAGGITGIVPDTVAQGVQFLAAFAILLSFDPVLAVFACLLGPVFIMLGRISAHKLRDLHLRCQETESKSRSFLQEILQNIPVVKAFNLEASCCARLKELQSQRLTFVMKRSRVGAASGAGLSIGYWTGYFFALVWGSYRLAAGMTTFGTLAAFLQLVGQVQGPFHGLARTLPRSVSVFASAWRLMELEKLPAEDGTADGRFDPESGELDALCNKAGIMVDNVTFGYKRDDVVLKRVSMEVRPGELVAIAGPSGEGKTTLMRLLLAFIAPAEGKIELFDGSGDRIKISSATRRYFSYVPQGNTIFSGTVMENLRIGNPEASMEEIEACARMACAWDFIAGLPEQMDTVIGEHGLGLSEGQAQRIAIARALLRKAPILLLDEPTSALDAAAETAVLEAIRNASPARTCIIVTHRPSVLITCDHVFRLEKCRMSELAAEE